YDSTATITESDTAFTSTTDSNLASRTFGGQANSETLTGLTPNTVYYANIFAYDSWGNVSSSTEASTTTSANVPGTPTATASTTTQIDLSWSASSNAAGTVYEVYNVTTSTIVATTTATTYSVTGLSSNTSYQFKIRAENLGSSGTYSSYSSDSTAVYTYANAVNNFTLTNTTNTTTLQIQLTWDDNGQTGMKIERDNACDGSYDVTIYDNASANETSPTTTATNVSVNTGYCFRASSYNAGGVLNTASVATTGKVTTPPGQVQNVTAASENVERTQVIWAWDAVTSATGYYLYDNFTSSLVDTVIGATSYIHTPLLTDTLYEMIIRAYNGNGSGIASTAASVSTHAAVPTGLTLDSRTTETITWSWDDGGQTSFYPLNVTLSTSSDWTSSTSWLETGLSANTAYLVKVKAKNADNVPTEYGGSITRYTSQNPPESVSFSSTTVSSITVTVGGTFPNNGTGSSVINFNNGVGTSQDVTSGLSWANSSLSPNVEYTYTVYAKNADDVDTTSVSDSTYTLANAAGQVTSTPGTSATTMLLTLDSNSNPDSTNVLLYSTTTGQYVSTSDGSLSDSSSNYDTFTSWDTVEVTGLSVNTGYQFSAIAKNGDDIITATSTDSTIVYTRANAPADLSVSVDGTTQMTATWTGNSNPDGTQYYIEDSNDSSNNSGWTTALTHVFTGLDQGTDYTFKVKARNTDSLETDYISSSGQTEANTSVALPPPAPNINSIVSKILDVGQPTLILTPATPDADGDAVEGEEASEETEYVYRITNGEEHEIAVEVVDIEDPELTEEEFESQLQNLPTVEANVVSGSFSAGSGVGINVGVNGDTHHVLYRGVEGMSAQFSIHSDPYYFDLQAGEEKVFDLDGDDIADLHIQANDIDFVTGNTNVTITDLAELPLMINDGMSYTETATITLRLGDYDDVETIAVSEFEDFRDVSFMDYEQFITYTFIDSEPGEKTIYARFRTRFGAVAEVSDSIILAPPPPPCPLKESEIYFAKGSEEVYLITDTCTRILIDDPEILATYIPTKHFAFQTNTSTFAEIPIDTLYTVAPSGFRKEFQSGSLIKTVSDPKVYVLLGNMRHWIASEAIFNKLSYAWGMIENVSEKLLDVFKPGKNIISESDLPEDMIIFDKTDQVYYRLERSADDILKKRLLPRADLEQYNMKQGGIPALDNLDHYQFAPGSLIPEARIIEDPDAMFTKRLYFGVQDEEVRKLQQALNWMGYITNGEIDGYMGIYTVQALQSFQEDKEIEPTGHVDAATREILNQ
ncbi:MAG: hypothetical protein HOG08_01630, partial [Candidatus Magasanikbacteria bacterium]|nr:hypothetical protein [Candidatus Magasanikbacteria bacterium]